MKEIKLKNLEEQEKYLYDKKGHPVNFKYPKGEQGKSGILKDRVVIFDRKDDNVTYWNLIDLIEFKDEKEQWLRITYYRYKKDGHWIFAGQTSIADPLSKFVELFVKAIKETLWARQLFKEIFTKCKCELKS